ncbi:MAG: hypothetical protein COA45_00070 [Zetaproteobacteria bacterium]|nr:MAG: hypothetical protein COA45_00070 [Zetaproteobacteria bacterium]
MSNKKQNTESLIASLSDNFSGIKVMPHPIRHLALWSVLAVSYTLLIIIFLKIRPDLSDKLENPNYIFELLQILAISISAAFCSSWLCVPDMRGQKWMLVVPITLFVAFSLQIILRTTMETHDLPHIYFHHCSMKSIIFGVIPAIALFLMSTRGKTTHPISMSLMNALAIGGMGYLGLRIICMSDNIGHLYGYHLLPYILFGIIISLVGRRIYRW